jgi:hypothetical protein
VRINVEIIGVTSGFLRCCKDKEFLSIVYSKRGRFRTNTHDNICEHLWCTRKCSCPGPLQLPFQVRLCMVWMFKPYLSISPELAMIGFSVTNQPDTHSRPQFSKEGLERGSCCMQCTVFATNSDSPYRRTPVCISVSQRQILRFICISLSHYKVHMKFDFRPNNRALLQHLHSTEARLPLLASSAARFVFLANGEAAL